MSVKPEYGLQCHELIFAVPMAFNISKVDFKYQIRYRFLKSTSSESQFKPVKHGNDEICIDFPSQESLTSLKFLT
jgi:hypothetical protein